MMASELSLVQLLRTQGLTALEPLAIKARRHGTYPNLICFKYDQRLSPMDHPAVQEARGIILDEADDWNVVSMSFRKFFNLDEPLAAPIAWETATVEEKLDGSLMTLYWYDGQWQVQSSGTADAAGQVVSDIRTQGAKTFRELFWQTFEALGYVVPGDVDRDYTFAFELMTPANQVVVEHATPRLVLHGVRNLKTLQEEEAAPWAERLGYEPVKTFSLTQESIVAAAEALPVGEAEGFVVRDANFNRVKIKASHYVRLSHVKERWTPERAAEIVLKGEADEFAAYFPQYKEELEGIATRLEEVYEKVEAAQRSMTAIVGEDQKWFAAIAGETVYAAVLFALRSGKHPTMSSWLLAQTETAQIRFLRQWGVI